MKGEDPTILARASRASRARLFRVSSSPSECAQECVEAAALSSLFAGTERRARSSVAGDDTRSLRGTRGERTERRTVLLRSVCCCGPTATGRSGRERLRKGNVSLRGQVLGFGSAAGTPAPCRFNLSLLFSDEESRSFVSLREGGILLEASRDRIDLPTGPAETGWPETRGDSRSD